MDRRENTERQEDTKGAGGQLLRREDTEVGRMTGEEARAKRTPSWSPSTWGEAPNA